MITQTSRVMAASVRASTEGLERVDKARRRKGWAKNSDVWASLAYTSVATLKRFWAGINIRTETFQSICLAVGLTDWKEIVDRSSFHSQESKLSGKRLSFAIVGSIEEIDKTKLDAIVALLKKLGGDTSIEILDIDDGSIKLILGGSEEALERINNLFEENISEIQVLDVHFLSVKELANLIIKNGAEYLNLKRVNLRGADLREANLRGADLREANLRGADLREANLREANLREANLRGADLREAALWGADLREANLRGADLRGADLRGALLREADLRGADLRKMFLSHLRMLLLSLFTGLLLSLFIRILTLSPIFSPSSALVTYNQGNNFPNPSFVEFSISKNNENWKQIKINDNEKISISCEYKYIKITSTYGSNIDPFIEEYKLECEQSYKILFNYELNHWYLQKSST